MGAHKKLSHLKGDDMTWKIGSDLPYSLNICDLHVALSEMDKHEKAKY